MARQSAPPPSSSAPTKNTKVKKTRWYRQVWQAYTMTRSSDPAVTWWVLGSFVGVMAIGAILGAVFHQQVYLLIVAFPFALLAGMFVLARRAETAAYAQLDGQPGAARAALGTIRRGWTFPEEPVAVDPRTQDIVFRGIGRPGVVLVSEGPSHRATRLLEAERKRTARLVAGVPITLIQTGDGEGQVPLRKLPRAVQKLKPKLTKQETAEVIKRLNALGAMRMPVPKGIDPTKARPDRKGMRGR